MAEVESELRLFIIWQQDDTYQEYIRPTWEPLGVFTIISDQFDCMPQVRSEVWNLLRLQFACNGLIGRFVPPVLGRFFLQMGHGRNTRFRSHTRSRPPTTGLDYGFSLQTSRSADHRRVT